MTVCHPPQDILSLEFQCSSMMRTANTTSTGSLPLPRLQKDQWRQLLQQRRRAQRELQSDRWHAEDHLQDRR